MSSARRLQSSYQARQSISPHHSVEMEEEDDVNDHYSTQHSTSFSDLLRFQSCSIMSEDTFYDANEGNEENVLTPEQHRRTPSLSKALARVRESIVGVNSQFECPVCFEEMKPPVHMFQCRQGHVVCQVLE